MNKTEEILLAIRNFEGTAGWKNGVDGFIEALSYKTYVPLPICGYAERIQENFSPYEGSDVSVIFMMDKQLWELTGFRLHDDELFDENPIELKLEAVDSKRATVHILASYEGQNMDRVEKVREAIQNYPVTDKYFNPSQTFAQDLFSRPDDLHRETILEGLGKVVHQDEKKGVENGGLDIWIVFSCEGHLYKLSGYYDSYDGSNYESATLSEVVAKQKTITVYEELTA